MSSTPVPSLSQMHWLIKQQIVNCCDTSTKIELSRCSKKLREHVSNAGLTYFQLSLRYSFYDRISVSLKKTWHDEECVDFVREPEGYVKQMGDRRVSVEDGDYIHAAVEQFMKVLKDPNTKLTYLSVTLESPSRFFKWHLVQRMRESLESLNHLISVGSFYMETDGNSEDVQLILSHLEPGTLRRITLLSPMPDLGLEEEPQEIEEPIVELSEIAELEQWRQAVNARVSMYTSGIGPEDTEHFLVYSYHLENLDLNELENIIEGIQQKRWLSRSVKFENMAREVRSFLLQYPKTLKPNGVEFELEVCEDKKTRVFVSLERDTQIMTVFTRSL